MKLACVRCKQKKIKCDKDEPVCKQCVAADTECVYVERRKRPRLAQQKNDVRELRNRIEFLEHQLHGSEHTTSASPESPARTVEPPDQEPLPDNLADATVTRETGKESWIYRMASDTRHQFEQVNTKGATPNDTPDAANVDTAISGLKEALDNLESLRVRSDKPLPKAPALGLSPEEAKKCVKSFRGLVPTMVVPDAFASGLDLSILEVLPDLIDSPYVKVDPAMRVAYYNALFYGLHSLRGPGNDLSKVAYLKLLESVPEWLEAATGTDLDGHCALLTAYTTIHNFDYQLSWKFHCRACHFLKVKGVDRLDSVPIRSNEEEDRRQNLRYLYFLVLQTDLFFRMFNNKPAAIRWRPGRVKPPTLFTARDMNPSATQSIMYVVFLRYTIMTAEILDIIGDPTDKPRDTEVLQKVDDCCAQLEEIVREWNLLSLMENSPKADSWLWADHIMGIYIIIIGIRRLVREPNHEHTADPITLRAARMVVSIILRFNDENVASDENYFFYFHFISFYSFCVVFTLYEHIVGCTNPDDCEEDLQALEGVAGVMNRACEINFDFKPHFNTINALNKVSRSMQDVRRNSRKPNTSSGQQQPAQQPGLHVSSRDAHYAVPQSQQQQQQQPQQFSTPAHTPSTAVSPDPLTTAAPLQPSPHHSQYASPFNPNFVPAFPALQDFATNFTSASEGLAAGVPGSGDVAGLPVQPVDFIRALESDFMGRNWHETWWDFEMDGAAPAPGGAGAGSGMDVDVDERQMGGGGVQ
ncbi:hypothetical protein M011DRAFT_468543 [Sporormia fimetaria CBS 119925]|uniref:Zn(2)-C6 fungal-type domain-containing protein n=1 Tax=Sporormia fimetaria CBS 119925 TaxID=1340428 RepID=A0A6A6V6Y0_9PLEO|nr:hypothetical protein M011DRAFT_468543 [Sporormia fimetaria CBS 119925]